MVMKLQFLDTETMAIGIEIDPGMGWRLLERLSSLLVVAADCSVPSIGCGPVGYLAGPVRKALEELAHRNPILKLEESSPGEGGGVVAGRHLVGRDAGFICSREAGDGSAYSISMAEREGRVDLGARCAYLLADLMGFPSMTAFEVRISVYELLNNTIEYGIGGDRGGWLHLELKRAGEKLFVSITDSGAGFDPTGEVHFDLNSYLRSGRHRGLGLIMARRIAERLRYSRVGKRNLVLFEKSAPVLTDKRNSFKEGEMSQLEIGDLQARANGSYVIRLEGDLDNKGALAMEDLMRRLQERKIRSVVLDFERIPFISSAGVGILLGMVSSIREDGGEVSILKPSPKVQSVFRLLNLEDYFTILETV